MKKVLSILLIVGISLTALTGCSFLQTGINKVDDVLLANAQPDFFEKRPEGEVLDYGLVDNLVVSKVDENKIMLTNNPKGYQIELPKDVKFDTSLNYLQTKVMADDFSLRITREWSPYDDVDWYIDTYIWNFVKDADFRIANDLKFERGHSFYNDYGYDVETHSVSIKNMENDNYDRYTYAIIKGEGKIFFFLMFKYNNSTENMESRIEEMLNSFTSFPVNGEAKLHTDYKPGIPKNWSEETKTYYDNLVNSNELQWGLFSKDIYNEGINKTIPELEEKLEYEFPVVLSYFHFNQEFPLEFLKKNWEDGKIVELTYQMTSSNNEKLYGYTPNIDVYRGSRDEDIRKLAQGFKEFGHPVLFRINNEMNSDWVSYGGVVNMIDPEIFIDNWQRMYRIFEEEGVNNVIWIFNPNDRNHPPCDWNSALCYYPGDEYVQMIGVTGYNNGTYYAEEHGETWREFEEIYDKIKEEYGEIYGKFPWIITEFSSSSIGGDKVKWIDSMFECIDKYKNIKIAVWFNFADYDFREDRKDQVSRPYWLDETPETLEAFKRGLKNK